MKLITLIALSSVLFLFATCSNQGAAQENAENFHKEPFEKQTIKSIEEQTTAEETVSEQGDKQKDSDTTESDKTFEENGNESEKIDDTKIGADVNKQNLDKAKVTATPPKTNKSVKRAKKSASNQQKTTNAETFYVIGMSRTVGYNDDMEFAKALEGLWSQITSNDFSGKLDGNIVNKMKVYTVFSDYDNPQGKMTITLGYKVKNLTSTPKGLTGKKILGNDFLVYPLKGDDSDYSGKAWKQFEKTLSKRTTESSDFIVYIFDENYNVTKGQMWIATQ